MLVKGYSVGDKVTFIVERNGKRVEIELTLREKVPDSVSFD